MFSAFRWKRYVTYDEASDMIIVTWAVYLFNQVFTVARGHYRVHGEARPHDTLFPEQCWCKPADFMGLVIHRDDSVPQDRMMILSGGKTWTRRL